MFHFSNFERGGFLSFSCERIEQGNNVLLHKINDFYLIYLEYYYKEHFTHDTYLYGYESDGKFHVMAYADKKLIFLKNTLFDI